MESIRRADLVIINGDEGRSAIGALLKKIDHRRVVNTASLIHQQNDAHIEDRHYFINPFLIVKQIEIIALHLALIRPDLKDTIETKKLGYLKKIMALQVVIEKLRSKTKDLQVMVVRDVLEYFAKAFEFKVITVLKDFAHHQPTGRDVALANKLLSQGKAKLILVDKHAPSKYALQLAQSTGVPVIKIDTFSTGVAHTSLDDYERRMHENIQVVEKALSQLNKS